MPLIDDCIFCKIIRGQIPCFKLYEDARTLAFMDINPVNPGHALVVPKFHAPNLFETPDEWLAVSMATARKVATAVQDVLAPHGLNLVQANGPGAAQSVLHLHLHILPRAQDDNLALNWGLRPGKMDDINDLAQRLRERIDKSSGVN